MAVNLEGDPGHSQDTVIPSLPGSHPDADKWVELIRYIPPRGTTPESVQRYSGRIVRETARTALLSSVVLISHNGEEMNEHKSFDICLDLESENYDLYFEPIPPPRHLRAVE